MKIQEIVLEQKVNEAIFVPAALLAGLQSIWGSTLVQALWAGLNLFWTAEGIIDLVTAIRKAGLNPNSMTDDDWFYLVFNLALTALTAKFAISPIKELLDKVPDPIKKKIGAWLKNNLGPLIKKDFDK
jgi:hypothetical protein